MLRITFVVLVAVLTWPGAQVVDAQTYPARPVRIISAEPGGSGDRLTRMLVPALAERLGQQVVVENRGGGGGVIAIETVVKAAPDGYTLLSYGSIWILPLLRHDLSYDVLRDLSAVSMVASSPNVLVVHPSLPAKSVRELIALSKSRPGQVNYGTGGTGSSSHLAAELFNAMAQVKLVRIPYKGAGQALIALVGGQVDLVFSSAGSVAPHVKSGRLRALGATSASPTPLLPGLPAISATVPGYESVYMLGMFAPARTPPAIMSRLNQEIVRSLGTPEMKERFFNDGVEIVGSSPEEFTAAIKSEIARLGKVIKDAGIRGE
jgi:tripartite-type tricarboxylate transporter receptor subunit TctC